MRVLTPAILVFALLAGSSMALAADATGTIKSLDMSRDMVTLDNGSSYMAPKSVNLSTFKVGEKVTINYAMAAGKMDITSMKPAT